MAFRKLNMDQVKESLEWRLEKGHDKFVAEMKQLQIAVFMACGGGHLGSFAARQPADFYIDMRVGRLPYPKRNIEQAVQVLTLYAEMAGYDPHGSGRDGKLPMPQDFQEFHSAGLDV